MRLFRKLVSTYIILFTITYAKGQRNKEIYYPFKNLKHKTFAQCTEWLTKNSDSLGFTMDSVKISKLEFNTFENTGVLMDSLNYTKCSKNIIDSVLWARKDIMYYTYKVEEIENYDSKVETIYLNFNYAGDLKYIQISPWRTNSDIYID